MIITSNTIPSALKKTTSMWFDAKEKEYNYQWKNIYEVRKSEEKYEEITSLYDIGKPSRKSEGSPVTYDSWSQGLTTRFSHVYWALGIPITIEAIEDYKKNLGDIIQMSSKKLLNSHGDFSEELHFALINNCFNSYSIPEGGDGKTLASDSHIIKGGTYSNVLPSVDFSRTAFQNALVQIRKTPAETSIRLANIKPTKLLIPTELEYEARQILYSPKEPETENNGINPIYNREGRIELIVSNYLTSENAWFVLTDASEGFLHFDRTPLTIDISNDFDTKNTKISALTRYSNGVANPRAIYANEGI